MNDWPRASVHRSSAAYPSSTSCPSAPVCAKRAAHLDDPRPLLAVDDLDLLARGEQRRAHRVRRRSAAPRRAAPAAQPISPRCVVDPGLVAAPGGPVVEHAVRRGLGRAPARRGCRGGRCDRHVRDLLRRRSRCARGTSRRSAGASLLPTIALTALPPTSISRRRWCAAQYDRLGRDLGLEDRRHRLGVVRELRPAPVELRRVHGRQLHHRDPDAAAVVQQLRAHRVGEAADRRTCAPQ